MTFLRKQLAGPDIKSFTIDNFTTDANYCFYIRANLEGNSFSTSNKACILTRMQRPPEWINADYATVNPESGIMLSFTIDPESEIKHFLLEKKIRTVGCIQLRLYNLNLLTDLFLYRCPG